MILFVNGCPREGSRTKRLAEALLRQLGTYEEIDLYYENLQPLDRECLAFRTEKIEQGDYKASMFSYAKQFAAADEIVIAVPYWDMSFPSVLKTYVENIYVTGIVSRYGADGRPVGLCGARKLWYVTTAGGPLDTQFGYEYIRALAQQCFGIPNTELIKAEMLDVFPERAEEILERAISEIGESAL